MSISKSRTEKVTLACSYYFCKKGYGVHTEIGLKRKGRLRADVLAMTLSGYMVIVEVKQSRADFTQDKKWPEYKGFCNKLYFGFPADLWEKLRGKDLVPKGVGVLVLSEKTGRVFVAQRAAHQELPKGMQKQLVMRMAWRGSEYNRKNTPRIQKVFLTDKEKL